MRFQTLSPPSDRQQLLFDALLTTVDQLQRCRAAEIPEGYIEDYVALDWLKWDAGALRLTAGGDQVCKQLLRNLA